MEPRQLDFTDVRLYAVTSSNLEPDFIFKQSEELLKGGVDALQLRHTKLTDRQFLELGEKLKTLCHVHNALFLVNDRPDLALILDADGVHVGQDDIPIEKVRELVGYRKIIGASTHSVPQAIRAQKAGADYVSCGPLWATPTKPTAEAVGVKLIGLYRAAVRVPFVCIGGVDQSNLPDVVKAGGQCVAVVRALFDAKEPQKTAKEFKTVITGKLPVYP